ncbi:MULTISPECIES: hypothetical protein [unclassified Moraxella]|uniref:hypothetical protein n=1 Tax=unclassified Moraxella TaxID=2685852 RepID=UPI003AF94B10
MNDLKSKLNDKLKNFIGKIRKINFMDFISELNGSQRYYFFGIIISFVGYVVFRLFSNPVLFYFGLLLIVFGIISDMLYVTHKIIATLIGKIALIVITPLITTIGYALSSQTINQIVGFDSSSLNYSVAFTAILLTPFLFLILGIVLYVVLIISPLLALIFHMVLDVLKRFGIKSISHEKYPVFSIVTRIIIYAITLSVLNNTYHNMQKPYEDFVTNTAKFFIYNFEAKTYSRCSNVPIGSKVITVNENNDEIILVSKVEKDYVFNAVACIPKIKKNLN